MRTILHKLSHSCDWLWIHNATSLQGLNYKMNDGIHKTKATKLYFNLQWTHYEYKHIKNEKLLCRCFFLCSFIITHWLSNKSEKNKIMGNGFIILDKSIYPSLTATVTHYISMDDSWLAILEYSPTI